MNPTVMADVSFNIAGKCFARPRVNCESKAEMSNYTSPPSVYAILGLVILSALSENLAALIESPAFRERAFRTRAVDKETFPEVHFRKESHTWRARS